MEREVANALVRFRARWSAPMVDQADVEERAAIRLEEDEREVLVLTRPPEVRLFVRAPELDRVQWGKPPRLHRGWRSGYVHELADVDRILDGLVARLSEAA